MPGSAKPRVEGRFKALPPHQLPRPQRAIICHPGSLTRLLRSKSRRSFAVRVLSEGIRVPTPAESRFLAMDPRQRAWIREVQLEGDGEAWVRARTVIPLSTLTGPSRALMRLGRRPLGSALFRRDPWRRTCFTTGTWTLPEPDSNSGWGRRSLFRKRGRQLLVTEYFQGPFWRTLAQNASRYHRVRSDARRPL